jgi:hypothetical protein
MNVSQYLFDWFEEDIRRVPITPITLRHMCMEFSYGLADEMGAATWPMPEIDNVMLNHD